MNTASASQQNSQQILQDLQSDDTDVIRGAAFAAGDSGLAASLDLLCKCVSSSNIGVQEACE
ncbi:MAG: hypothetical protein LBH94_00605, partial [Deltaproteobacteria bacterium]|nr:hypothetical protein [Deltaproteobacteria bacterium]